MCHKIQLIIFVIICDILKLTVCDPNAIYACDLINRTYRSPNRCETIDDIIVEERIYSGKHVRFWCIIIDNRRRIYNGQSFEIDVAGGYGLSWLIATKISLIGLRMKFKLNSGVNRIIIYGPKPRSPLPGITTIMLSNRDLCKKESRPHGPREQVERFDDYEMDVENRFDDNDEYRFLTHCSRQRESVEYTTFCDGVRIPAKDFIIQTYKLGGQKYWCINFDRDRINPGSHILTLTFRGAAKALTWIPAEAYFSDHPMNSNIRNIFHIGEGRVTISAAPNEISKRFPLLDEILIDDIEICDYYRSQAEEIIIPTVTQRIEVTTPTTTPIPITTQPNIIETPRPPPNPINKNKNPACGQRLIQQPLTLITNGFKTREGLWPWHVALYHNTKFTRSYVCGGTLINRKTILTAAHCIIDGSGVIIPERISVELGRFDLQITSNNIQTLKVFDVIPHEKYSPESFENDIGLLKLATFAQINRFVQVICLPQPNALFNNQIGQIVGWGRNEDNMILNEMRHAPMPVIDRITCLRSNRNHFGQYLTETNFCAGNQNSTSVCRGDSGSGLVFEDDGTWTIGGITSLGISSAGSDLCDLTQYVLFTEVSKYIDWIETTLHF